MASARYDPGLPAVPLNTVARLAAPASALAFPVFSGEALTPGRIRVVEITARLISDGTSRPILVRVNGADTNMTSQFVSGIISAAAAGRGTTSAIVGISDTRSSFVNLKMFTAKTAAGLRRHGIAHVTSTDVAGSLADTVYVSGFLFNDTSTVITAVSLDVAAAGGLLANSEGYITEYEV